MVVFVYGGGCALANRSFSGELQLAQTQHPGSWYEPGC